ncbi:MAG: cytochrome c biogenesis protein CcdA [Catenulispora sp.]|nr:cytochrome c biogenesis protein CcdA [Catenulispora sp.]
MALDVTGVVGTGPLLLAVPLAAAAGAVSFFSPCCLPLVPGYVSYVTGMAGADAADEADLRSTGRRTLAGTGLFVLGFSALFAAYGAAFGGLGALLLTHQQVILKVLGAVTIVLGLLFLGVLGRVPLANRSFQASWQPRMGLAGAPALGMMFGLGWTPCIGPTLGAVLSLSVTQASAGRGALLAFVYALGLGIPFLVAAFAFSRGVRAFAALRRHSRTLMRIGGVMLVAVGLAQVTGLWTEAITLLRGWSGTWRTPL